jgi:TRAP-type C4-dicarboxylate transport system substrate-binding protein
VRAHRRRWLAVFALLIAAATGCTSLPGADKSGGDGPMVTLVLGTSDRVGMANDPAFRMFVGEVDRRSEGHLRIEVEHFAQGDRDVRSDQQVARRVVDGDLDLALVPARAWDDLGVGAMRALQAPFLVDSDPLVDQIVTSDLAGTMLDALDAADVHGLALWPEGLRHPFGFARPFLTRRDLAGATLRAPYSRDTYDLLRALGAQPIDVDAARMTLGISTGEIDGAETSADLAVTLPSSGSLTADVTLYAKIDSLIASHDAWARLSDDNRDAVREAAVATRDWLVAERPSERQALARACAAGGVGVVEAGASAVADLERAAGLLTRRLETDPSTAAAIAAIRRMKADLPEDDTPVAVCPLEDATVDIGKEIDPAVLDGTYRTSFTVEELLAAGGDEANSISISGLWTITLDSGRYSDLESECTATYQVSATMISFAWDPGGRCSGDWSGRWQLTPKGLRFVDVQSPAMLDRYVWGQHEWLRLD